MGYSGNKPGRCQKIFHLDTSSSYFKNLKIKKKNLKSQKEKKILTFRGTNIRITSYLETRKEQRDWN